MPDRFKVCWSGTNREAVKQIGKKAKTLGLAAEAASALKTIVEKLANEPLTWGDPNYQLHSAGLVVHHAICLPFHVYYGVDEAKQLVYIKKIEALPGHPLAES
jgi:hypothetical protein